MFHGCVASNIAATPQGGSDLICHLIVFEGNRCIRYRSLAHPLAMLPEPLKGFSCIIHAVDKRFTYFRCRLYLSMQRTASDGKPCLTMLTYKTLLIRNNK